VLTRFGILPALVSKRRLSGHGQPLARLFAVAAAVFAVCVLPLGAARRL